MTQFPVCEVAALELERFTYKLQISIKMFYNHYSQIFLAFTIVVLATGEGLQSLIVSFLTSSLTSRMN